MMRTTLISLALLTVLAQTAYACSCIRPGPFEDRFCAAKTSVLGKVVARYDECPGTCDALADQGRSIFYVIRVLRHFRGQTIEDGVFTMRTGVNSALCGTSLRIDSLYVFMLSFKNNDPKACPSVTYPLSLCDQPTLWSSLTRKQRRFAHRGQRSCPKKM